MMPRLTADDRGVRTVVGVEFRKNALDSPFDGVLGDAEVIRNLLVRLPGGDEAQHDEFGRCQRLIADMLSDLERRLRRQTPLASMDRSDGLQQIRMERVLEQVALSTRLDGAEDVRVALVGREHDDLRIVKLRANGDERVEAIHLRHLQVHQRHVGPMGPELLDGLATVRGFARPAVISGCTARKPAIPSRTS